MMDSLKKQLRSSKKKTTKVNKNISKNKLASKVQVESGRPSSLRLSSKQLITVLSQMGIVTPRSINIEVVSSLYDVNAKLDRFYSSDTDGVQGDIDNFF